MRSWPFSFTSTHTHTHTHPKRTEVKRPANWIFANSFAIWPLLVRLRTIRLCFYDEQMQSMAGQMANTLIGFLLLCQWMRERVRFFEKCTSYFGCGAPTRFRDPPFCYSPRCIYGRQLPDKVRKLRPKNRKKKTKDGKTYFRFCKSSSAHRIIIDAYYYYNIPVYTLNAISSKCAQLLGQPVSIDFLAENFFVVFARRFHFFQA